MTKHSHKGKQPSLFLPKLSIDWCHICGVRDSRSIEITYPQNAEAEIHQTKERMQGNVYSQYIHDDIIDEIAKERAENNGDKFVRICKKCLKHSMTILNEEERKIINK